jgi:hypothetical protein
MIMKGAIVLLAVMLALMPAMAAAQTSSDINVVLMDQTPSPAEPGSNVDIQVQLQNNGLREASNVALQIVPSGPFSLVKGDAVKTFTRIGAGDSFQLTYTLFVDDSALAGDYDLEFRVFNPVTPESYTKRTVEVTVIGETKLTIEKVETIPSNLEPGGKAAISVTVKNVGSGDARQLEARMESEDTDLVPILSGGLVYVGDLPAGEEKTIDFMFNIDPDASQVTYLTTLTMSYKNENNQDSSETFTVGIPVTGTINFEIVGITPSFTDGELDIEVANKGTGDASSLEARLIVDGNVIGVDYVSSLKATKKTTLNFPLVMSGNAQLELTYMEPGLEEIVVTKELGPLNFAAPGGSSSSTFFFLIVLVVVGYFVWRRWFRKKKKSPQHH